MKFRIFLGIVCLGFVLTLLSYGSNLFTNESAELVPTAEPTPELIVELSEELSCEGEEIELSNEPIAAGMVGRPSTLLPFSDGPRSQIETELSRLIFRGLVRYSAEGEPLPDLASWQVSDDGLTVNFTFDQGGIWHDGTPVTANDVAFTVSTLASGDYSVPGSFPWETVNVNVIDQATVQLALPVPYAPLLEAATVGLLPAHLALNAQNLAGSDFAQRPVGNGDFRVINQWESDGLILLEPVDPSILDGVEVRFYPSAESMMTEFKAGELEIAIMPDYESISQLGGLSAEQFTLFTSPTSRSTQLFFRMDGAETDSVADAAVRQALRLALDRRQLVENSAGGQGVLIDGPWFFENRFNDESRFPLVKQDVTQAELLLDEAGWLLPDEATPSSIRQKEEVALALNIVVPDVGINFEIGQELASQWSALGIRTTLNALPPADYAAAIDGRQFDVTVQQIRLPNDPDLYDFWSQEAIVRGQNISRWNNRSASEALEAGRQVWDFELRKPYYSAFQTFYENELPAFPLFQDVRTIVVSTKVHGQKIGYPGDLGEFMSPFPQWFTLVETSETNCNADS